MLIAEEFYREILNRDGLEDSGTEDKEGTKRQIRALCNKTGTQR